MRKFTEPQLLVDDHHGVYMMQLLIQQWKAENNRYWKQIARGLDDDLLQALLSVDNEWHNDACCSINSMTFKTPTGQKFEIAYAEGGIWAIPYCFKGKKLEEFLGF